MKNSCFEEIYLLDERRWGAFKKYKTLNKFKQQQKKSLLSTLTK